ncbi:unnamed protein product [Cyprideis torosa]|uniref:Sodium-dependent nutrient amino acid transporter 1 n=1 Tax=Cyprideis torosa TaxID=163714 RepID=A0A7R8WGQ7_9CRUS|nr:unnamed protein product [Cyprideis torosa]CAG0898483.1 unnamed protein product [Cyprideis torosa]
MNFKVWEQACVQVMGSLSLGAGGLVTLASYNNYDYNLVRDTLVIGLGNSLTSMYAGLAIFSSLGYMARELGVKIEDVARDGTALAFIAYPNLVLHMPWPMLWAVLFFIMLITLGLDSEFAIIENITTNLQDIYPQLRNHKKKLTGTVCFLGFLLGLIFCNGVGSYIMNFMDYYGNAPRFILTEYLCIGAVLYSLGIDKFYEALNSMVGFRVNSWYAKILKVIYLFVIPLYFAIIFILAIFYSKPLSVRDYAYPPAARWIGWLLAMVPISAVPYMFFKRLLWDFRGLPTWKDRWRALFTPTSRWYENHHKFIEGKIPTDGYFKNGETNLAFQENQQFSANVGLPPKHTLNSSIKNLTGPNVLEQYRSNLAADSKDTRL